MEALSAVEIKKASSTIDDEDYTTSLSSMFSTTVFSKARTTVSVDTTEFSVSGCLMYCDGTDFRCVERIAKRGGGEILLGEALTPAVEK